MTLVGALPSEVLYGEFPPEINSANIYAGPGPASLLAAAEAWESVAAQMTSEVFKPFMKVLDTLLAEWSGSSAMQMHQAIGPFFEWLIELEAQLGVIHKEIHRIHEAYLTARKKMVDPKDISANRDAVHQLETDNALGQNTAAIATLEAKYKRYWMDDVHEMTVYELAVLDALSAMTPWGSPPPITIETGSAQEDNIG